ncbi:tetraspanin-1 [Aplochiton taeniatus]
MGCFTFFKLMMFLFNLLIFLTGLTLLATGIWVSVNGGSYLQILGPFSAQPTQGLNVDFFCIAMGSALLLVGLLGGCVTHKESQCLLLMFFSMVAVVFIAELAAGTVTLAYVPFVEGILREWAAPALKIQYGNDPVVTKIWNQSMTKMKCCGLANFTDFVDSWYLKESGGRYPASCCLPRNSATCSQEEAELSGVQGCFEELLGNMRKHASILGGVAVGILGLEVAAMALALYLHCNLDTHMS